MKTNAYRPTLLLIAALAVMQAGAAAWARNAPDFSLPDSGGKTITLSAYRGKYVVVDFIQTTCPHCQVAATVLQKLYTEFPDRLVVISISHDSAGMSAVRQYVKDHGITYPVVLGDLKVAVDYLGITPQKSQFSVPVFFFIGKGGEVIEERNNDRRPDKDWFANMEQNLELSVRKMLPAAKPSKPAGKRPAGKKSP